MQRQLALLQEPEGSGKRRRQAAPAERRPIGAAGQPARRRAVTSISIFIAGSARPTAIIVAAGRIAPKAWRSTGQQGSKSAACGSRSVLYDVGERRPGLGEGGLDVADRLACLRDDVRVDGHRTVVVAGGAGDEDPLAVDDGA